MVDLHLDAVHQRAALEAVPFEGIERIGVVALRLDHEADRARGPLRRVPHMRRQQEHLALLDRHVVEIAVVADLEHHVALELVEELLHRVVMIVAALVRPADHLHGHVAVLEHLLVADRRLEQVLVLGDPFLEVEGLQPSGLHRNRSKLTPPTASPPRPAPSARRSRTRGASLPSRRRSVPASADAPGRRPAPSAPASTSNATAASRPDACA